MYENKINSHTSSDLRDHFGFTSEATATHLNIYVTRGNWKKNLDYLVTYNLGRATDKTLVTLYIYVCDKYMSHN